MCVCPKVLYRLLKLQFLYEETNDVNYRRHYNSRQKNLQLVFHAAFDIFHEAKSRE